MPVSSSTTCLAPLALACLALWACDEGSSGGGGAPLAQVYVSSQAAPGGDGSQARPFQTLERALGSGATTLHLDRGAYVMPTAWTFEADTQLLGGQGVDLVAPAGTTWRAQGQVELSSLQLQGVELTLRGGSWALRGLQLSHFDQGVDLEDMDALEAHEVSLSQVGGLRLSRLEQATVSGLQVSGGQGGVLAREVAQLQILDSAIRDTLGAGLRVERSSVEASALEVSGVQMLPDGSGGDGVAVESGALVMDGGAVERSADRGVSLVDSQATLRGVTLREAARPLVASAQGSQATLEGCQVGPGQACLFVTGAELSVEGGQVQSCGLGVLVADDSQLTVRGAQMSDCAGGHVSLNGSGIRATVEGSTLTGAQEACVSVSQTQAEVLIEGNDISQCQSQGVGMLLVDAVTVRGNRIHAIEPDPVFGVADGVGLVDSQATVEGNTIEDTRGRGVGLLRSSGLVAQNTLRGNEGGGLAVVDPHPEQAVLRGNTVEGAGGVGVLVFTADALVEDNQIRGTVLDSAAGLGDGLVFGLEAQVQAQGNLIEGNALNGVVFLEGARGLVSQNTLTRNGQYGIREYCGEVASQVTVAQDNVLDNNTLGDMLLCQ
jgi:nitrous oxidase accessory protein NosD